MFNLLLESLIIAYVCDTSTNLILLCHSIVSFIEDLMFLPATTAVRIRCRTESVS